MRIATNLLATFFGVGYFPVAPGTLASLIVALLYKAGLYQLPWPTYLCVGLGIYILGVWSSTIYAARRKKEDPRTVVIDEVMGQWIALFLLPPSWGLVLMSFFLFRIFDILKPFFIRKAETFNAGWGIMLDDILAGIYASIILNLYLLVR
jgi:phosphatidylglycerophosphatase A